MDNEEQMQKFVGILSKLPYNEIEIYNWVISDESTIFADGNDVFIDDIIEDRQFLCDFILDNKITYVEKNNSIIYIVTDVAKDYEQGIAWNKTNDSAELPSTDNLNIYYSKKIYDEYYFFKGRD